MASCARSLLGLLLLAAATGQAQTASKAIPMATDDRLQLSGWWPTKGTAPRNEFLGTDSCEPCHASKVHSQEKTAMAHAALRPEDSEQLRSHEHLTFAASTFHYDIARQQSAMLFSATDSTQKVSLPLQWAFGVGDSGQTYILQRGGTYYESQLSFFHALDGLDFTPGQSVASTIDGALGRKMPAAETQKCFGCHTTASTTQNHFDPEHLIPGITCEACHGPGAKHVAAMKAKRTQEGLKLIFDPGKLNPVDQLDFCGACHRTFADVVLAGTDGIRNVRFQPYRLERSQCWIKSGGITCLACHNPHQPRMRESTAYDDVCLGCHRAGAHTCSVGKNQCVSCHMPKYPMPGMHSDFTDHFIRIVRKGENYPD